jgi:stage V sporulation protein AE
MLLKSLIAFLIGGLLCVIAQIFIDKTSLTPAKILVSFVVFGVILGAVGLYKPLFELAGCGASVPLLGFGGNVAEGVREAIDNEGAIGILSGTFKASAVGCGAALFFGFIFSLFFRGGSKRL